MSYRASGLPRELWFKGKQNLGDVKLTEEKMKEQDKIIETD